jgi:histidinol-phosphatase (PHP family)
MIDSHTHSKYSKHAKGSIEDLVKSAIKKKIKILTITDHAPFPIDIDNRLLYDELKYYFDDIYKVQNKYKNDIKILKGLEADFIPEYIDYTKNLLSKIDLDFVIGSVHAVFIDNKRVNVWDIENLNNDKFISQYFLYLKELIKSNLFDTIGHADVILRGAIEEDIYDKNFYPLIELIKTNNISYEINSSGLRKTTYSLKSHKQEKNEWNYPSKKILSILNENSISFTIGSDAHNPNDVSCDINKILGVIKEIGLKKISYYDKRKRYDLKINDCLNGVFL